MSEFIHIGELMVRRDQIVQVRVVTTYDNPHMLVTLKRKWMWNKTLRIAPAHGTCTQKVEIVKKLHQLLIGQLFLVNCVENEE